MSAGCARAPVGQADAAVLPADPPDPLPAAARDFGDDSLPDEEEEESPDEDEPEEDDSDEDEPEEDDSDEDGPEDDEPEDDEPEADDSDEDDEDPAEAAASLLDLPLPSAARLSVR
jgi:hypothetical protein